MKVGTNPRVKVYYLCSFLQSPHICFSRVYLVLNLIIVLQKNMLTTQLHGLLTHSKKGWLGKEQLTYHKGSSLHNLPCNMKPNVAFFFWKSPALILMLCHKSPTYVECKNFNFFLIEIFTFKYLKFTTKKETTTIKMPKVFGGCKFSTHIGEYIIVAKMVGASMYKVCTTWANSFHKMMKRQLSFKFMIFSLETHSKIPFNVSMWIEHCIGHTLLQT